MPSGSVSAVVSSPYFSVTCMERLAKFSSTCSGLAWVSVVRRELRIEGSAAISATTISTDITGFMAALARARKA